MHAAFNWLAGLVTRRPGWILLGFLGLTFVAMAGAARVKAVFTMRTIYESPKNTLLPKLDQYNEEFGDDGSIAVLVIEADDVFTPPVLRYIQEVSRKLKRAPQFRRIMSLSLNTIPRGEGDTIATGPLFERVPEDPAALGQIRKVALASRLAVPRLVSKDGRYAMVSAEFKENLNDLRLPEIAAGNDAIREAMRTTPPPEGTRVLMGGLSVAYEAGPKMMIAEQQKLVPIGLLLIIVVMILCFGTIQSVLVTYAEVAVTLVWTFGFMGAVGITFNMVSSATPTILLVYGLMDSVFVLSMFYKVYASTSTDDGRGTREEKRQAVAEAIKRIGPACLITSLTTALGFASFATGSLPLTRTFGVGLAVGVIAAFLCSIILTPALLCVLPAPKRGRVRRSLLSRLFGAGLGNLAGFVQRHTRAIIVVGLVVFAGSAAILFAKAHFSVVTFSENPANMEGMPALRLVADKLIGVNSTAVQVSGKPGSMRDPKLLKALDQLTQWAEKRRGVKSVLSPSDLVRDMHCAFNGGSPDYDKIPNDSHLISQYLALLDPPTRADFVTGDYAKTHLRIMTDDSGSHIWRAELFEPLQRKAKELLQGYNVEFNGFMRTFENGTRLQVKEMIGGFLIAFLVIVVLLGVFYRSARLALLSVFPNFLPTLVGMAAVVASGESIRGTTIIFLSVAVGITFDNSIHLFTGIRTAQARGLSYQDAVRETIAATGPPIAYTSVLITVGLGILMLSSMPALFNLGLATSIVVLVAAVADLFITLALVMQWGSRLFVSKKAVAPSASADA